MSVHSSMSDQDTKATLGGATLLIYVVLRQAQNNLGNTQVSKTAQAAIDKISAALTPESHREDEAYFVPGIPGDWRCKWARYKVDHRELTRVSETGQPMSDCSGKAK